LTTWQLPVRRGSPDRPMEAHNIQTMPNLSNLPELFPPSVADEVQRAIARAKRTDIRTRRR